MADRSPESASGPGDLAYALAVVRSAGRRERAASLGSAALALALGALALRLLVGHSAADSIPGALAAALAAGVVATGAVLLARASLARPTDADVAAEIESARPGLRDSLSTAVESGPFACVSAAYARAALLASGGPPGLAPGARGRHAAVAASGAVSLAAAVLALAAGEAITTEGTEITEEGQVQEVPLSVASVSSVVAVDLPRRATVEAFRALPREAGPTPATPAAVETAARGPARLASQAPTAADVLLSAPPGYERALERFLSEAP